jgi:hypothetical protein
MKAWLVTWEWATNSAAVADQLAAIFPPRWDAARIAEHVTWLYAINTYRPLELARIAKRPASNPYAARISQGIVTCGHHPYLMARYVSDLSIVRDSDGLETVSWKEPDQFEIVDGHPVLVQTGERQEAKRSRSGPLSAELIWDRESGDFKPD